uniref:Uncharacterized protein n=1 Tax=Anguilla anguilla TaxID=7936 RepID=A0A0E9TLS1_ANGAN
MEISGTCGPHSPIISLIGQRLHSCGASGLNCSLISGEE